jgi:hypothetical protein
MVSELITLPLRVGTRAVRLSLYTAEEALRLTSALADQAIKTVRTPASKPAAPRTPEAEAEPEPVQRPSRPPEAADTPPPATPSRAPAERPEASEPTHVSSEPVLVEEVAEVGAEDGAGPEIRIDEPWPEYGQMTAHEIVARLEQASQAELAAVQLYETTHRARQSVLTTAERRLRTSGAPRPRDERKANHGR